MTYNHALGIAFPLLFALFAFTGMAMFWIITVTESDGFAFLMAVALTVMTVASVAWSIQSIAN